MDDRSLFWFRTRQALLEEWGYTVGLWHLVRRSNLSIVVIGISADGKPRCTAAGQLSEQRETRVALAIVNPEECDFAGPFALDRVPQPSESLVRRAAQATRAA
jgi:hypothetical protein